ncbi:Scr1 family TA system antitoxin-like transcriptional regulator [Saccharopolyspora erythraea]|uniref:DNA-binding SARP family transcriptional activator n=1 Tax=Saccharopolyspora erythraea TaxID=1836 RepID=A0ABN1CNX8_SACER|nr:Scr1 family TA system antitoxin-like transcriptional regulator [Saccharopolyspora erythraea]QRK92583.1 helix-turn-helix domain-containing protein [Saccharopolyspora erythraea]
MRFHVPGPLEVVSDGRPVPLGDRRRRAVLGHLLLHANQVVHTDRLAQAVQGDDLTGDAQKRVHNTISQLREVLVPQSGAAPGPALRTHLAGYLLRVDPDAVDLLRFRDLAERGRAELAAGAWEAPADRLREARELWRGPVLADLADEFPWPELTGIRHERLDALEDHFEAELACGRPTPLVPELRELVRAEPGRERLQRRLKRALSASGNESGVPARQVAAATGCTGEPESHKLPVAGRTLSKPATSPPRSTPDTADRTPVALVPQQRRSADDQPAVPSGAPSGVAAELRRLRIAAGLTGERLSARARMSQSKISKIENGRQPASPGDVERLLLALDASPATVTELLGLCGPATAEPRATCPRQGGHEPSRPSELITRSKLIRHALTSMLPGCLQIPEYRRRNAESPLARAGGRSRTEPSNRELDEQRALFHSDKHFHFLLTEAAVRCQVTSPRAMAVQVDHLVSVGMMPNADIAVLPQDVPLTNPLLNVFAVYDERLVVVRTHARETAHRDRASVVLHLELFDHLRQRALRGGDALDFLRRVAADFRGRSS